MKIAVLGAGSWGTALGQVLNENGHDVRLWHLEQDFVESLGTTIGDALLAINKSYLPAMDGILHKNWLVGISHITGGGIVDNTKRILGEGQDLEIDWNCWERPPIFKLIQELGNVPEDDMRHSMNLGIGLIVIVKPEGLSTLQTHLASQGEPYFQLGTVI